MNSSVTLLSLVVFLPTLGALLLAFFPKQNVNAMRWFSLTVTALVFVLTLYMALQPAAGSSATQFDQAAKNMQSTFTFPWIPRFDIYYSMGYDGISFPLVILTSFLSLLAMGASWPIDKHVRAYCILFLLLETGMLGVFLALDFFLFYVFWEVMLLPMYFLIGVWGGPRREYAAIKFFLYTLLGSVLMLIAILMLYFNSDLRELAKSSDLPGVVSQKAKFSWDDLHIHPDVTKAVIQAAADKRPESETIHTFNLMALAKVGQYTKLFDGTILGAKSLQWWAFLLLFIGFAVKVPSVPLHTWLPDAHVEAPTPISMILAGVLLKMGGYGIIRICYPICPDGGFDLAYFVCAVGVVSMVYGAFAAMAQKDFKRLVAYSSVSHMGYVVLGLGVWSALSPHFDPRYWQQGMNGAMFQMLAHGISSAGMFFMVGVVYDRVHHRNLDQFGGLFGRMPLYTALSIGIFFAGLGLPGLCGFIGEVFVTMSVWNFNQGLAVISAAVVILTAGYILWAIQRVYLGAEYKGPHGDHLTPITARELSIAVPLLVLAIFFGVYPQAIFNYLTPTVNQEVQQLADWTRDIKSPRLEAAMKTAKTSEDHDNNPSELAKPVGNEKPAGGAKPTGAQPRAEVSSNVPAIAQSGP